MIIGIMSNYTGKQYAVYYTPYNTGPHFNSDKIVYKYYFIIGHDRGYVSKKVDPKVFITGIVFGEC